MRAALADIHGVHLMYVAEIVPPAETAVVAFEGSFVPDTESEVSSAVAVGGQSAAGIWSRDRSAHL